MGGCGGGGVHDHRDMMLLELGIGVSSGSQVERYCNFSRVWPPVKDYSVGQAWVRDAGLEGGKGRMTRGGGVQ
jgi:hypothetical protein